MDRNLDAARQPRFPATHRLRSRTKLLGACILASVVAGLVGLRGNAQVAPKADADGLRFFKDKKKPTLTENCSRCHSHEAKKARGGLVVDSLGGMLKGGDPGPAVVPGQPEKSLLIKAVRQTDEE